jgi:diguanylate cyclase (GGDEF)-like protein
MNHVASHDRIRQLFHTCDGDDQKIFTEIEALARVQGEQIYSAVLSYLFGRDFSLSEAGHYWREATEPIRRADSPDQSFRALLLNYLRQKTTILNNPRIIESHVLEEIKRSAVTDDLTQLYNQSYFKKQLQQAIDLTPQEEEQTFGVLIFDLDYFKQFKDRCGHLKGDEILRKIAEIMLEICNELDLPARYGGDKFAILLPDHNLEEAFMKAETLRKIIASKTFSCQERLDSKHLTISGGVACYPLNGTTPEALIEAADRLLYQAKKTHNTILPRVEETRRARRHQFRNIVELKIEGQDEFTQVLSSNICQAGLSLKTDCSPAVGTRVELIFSYPFWPDNLETTGKIRHICGTPAPGTYRVGIEFDRPQEGFCEKLLPTQHQL